MSDVFVTVDPSQVSPDTNVIVQVEDARVLPAEGGGTPGGGDWDCPGCGRTIVKDLAPGEIFLAPNAVIHCVCGTYSRSPD